MGVRLNIEGDGGATELFYLLFRRRVSRFYLTRERFSFSMNLRFFARILEVLVQIRGAFSSMRRQTYGRDTQSIHTEKLDTDM